MSRMTKTRRVVPLSEEQPFDNEKVFEQRSEDNDYIVEMQLTISLEDWQAMGEPNVLTVTIEPGDALNIPGAFAHSEFVEEATTVPDQPGEPHSRACGVSVHPHGRACHTNCPTCGGNDSVCKNARCVLPKEHSGDCVVVDG